MNPQDPPPVPTFARLLGYAGLLPQVGVVACLILGGPDIRFTAQTVGLAYAALIFSFLGGVWWGLSAAARRTVPRGIWAVAVLPSLIALATALPWAAGLAWRGPSLVVLGVFVMSSAIVDLRLRSLDMTPPGWLALRLPLSVGLGALTLLAGLV
ncbi:MAG: DUF3429 domain-containing protein [Brevundimonas sp.]|uniref:DUF3429 domain-containing protein n=1 Tax=Brevundimonas sp. TaxID=1871086 RepID=UPI003919634C